MGRGIGVVEGDQPGGAIGDLAGKSDAGLADDLVQGDNGGLELGDQRGGLARRRVAGPAKSSPGIYGHDLGVFDGGLGDRSQLAGQAEHLLFRIAASSPQPGGDLMGATAHRTGAVPKPSPTGQAGCLDRTHRLGQLGHPFGEEPRVGRVGDVGGNDCGVSAHFVELDHTSRHGLFEQCLVQLVDGLGPRNGW